MGYPLLLRGPRWTRNHVEPPAGVRGGRRGTPLTSPSAWEARALGIVEPVAGFVISSGTRSAVAISPSHLASVGAPVAGGTNVRQFPTKTDVPRVVRVDH